MTDQPPYIYPGQWADELGSLYALSMNMAPAMANDLHSTPLPNRMKADLAAAIFRSSVNPYGG